MLRHLARLIALLALLPAALLPRGAAAQAGPRWFAGGAPPLFCVDATRPDTLLLSYRSPAGADPAGSYAFSWATGERSLLTTAPFDYCNPANGLLYTSATADSPGLLFSSDSPRPTALERAPTHYALDGSLQVYALGGGLWASADGGRSWRARRLPTAGPLFGMAVAAADGRALYLLAGAAPADGDATPYTLYFSPDGGASWERRGAGALSNGAGGPAPQLTVATLESAAAPLDSVLISTSASSSGRFGTSTTYLSTDGGRSFASGVTAGAYAIGRLLATRAGLLRLSGLSPDRPAFARSTDGGASWQPLDLPFAPRPGPQPTVAISQAFAAPDVLLLSDDGQALWLSTDGAASWRPLEGATAALGFTAALPLRALTISDGQYLLRDLPGAERSVVAPARPGPGVFAATGHAIGPLFRQAWEQRGGLAVYGYPITEPFREQNPADGRVYLVQYFERNRFEYHPAHAGAPGEVLLGLLGSQLTAGRRAAGEAPFLPLGGAGGAGARFFVETGHTLGAPFRRYWERGGLALFGYPISEPFVERNPADGRDYLVQYFERNRFEYHPELAGTSGEILLGLLGGQALHERGWR